MILGLYELLNRRIHLFGTRMRGFTLFIIVFITLLVLGSSEIFPTYVSINRFWVTTLISTTIISTGVLNPPYVYLVNMLNLKIKAKIFKKSIFVYVLRYGKIMLRKKKYLDTFYYKKAEGMLVEGKIYLREPEQISYPHNDEPILWGMKNKIVYVPDFIDFIETEIKNRDSPETIKRRILLKNLSV